MEMTVDQFTKLEGILSNLRDETAESRTETALIRQDVSQVKDHLAALNGRTGRLEERITKLEYAAIEARGAWKVIVAIASACGAAVTWAIEHISLAQK